MEQSYDQIDTEDRSNSSSSSTSSQRSRIGVRNVDQLNNNNQTINQTTNSQLSNNGNNIINSSSSLQFSNQQQQLPQNNNNYFGKSQITTDPNNNASQFQSPNFPNQTLQQSLKVVPARYRTSSHLVPLVFRHLNIVPAVSLVSSLSEIPSNSFNSASSLSFEDTTTTTTTTTTNSSSMNNNPNINSSANNNNSSSSSSSNNNNNSSYPIVSKPQLSKMEDIGIDARLVNPNSGKALECAICYELLKFPRQCRNGHLFCQACIVKHLQRNQNSCPMCKIELKEQDLARSILAEDQINSLLVYCRYHFTLENALKQKQSTDNNGVGSDEQQSSPKTMTHNGMSVWVQDPEGCQHNDSFQSIGSHEIQCQFGWVDCSYSSVCCVRKRDIEQHLQSCPFRPWKCPYCQIPVEKQLFEKHTQNDCERFPLKCKLCQAEVPRSEMDFEHKSVCPEQLVPCVFVAEGCQIKQVKKNSEMNDNRNNTKQNKKNKINK